jgi:PhnB protein
MTNRIKAVPEGYHTLTPHLIVMGASQAIEFYKKAFGAEISRLPCADGKSLMHAAIKIGDSRLFLVDEFPEMGGLGPLGIGGTPVTIHIYVDDVDTVFNQGCRSGRPSAHALGRHVLGRSLRGGN